MAQALRYSPQRSALTFRPTSMLMNVTQTRGPAVAPRSPAPGTPAPAVAATPQVTADIPSTEVNGNALLRAAGDGGGAPAVGAGPQPAQTRADAMVDAMGRPAAMQTLTGHLRNAAIPGVISSAASLAYGAPAALAAKLGITTAARSMVSPFSMLSMLDDLVPQAMARTAALENINSASASGNLNTDAMSAYTRDRNMGDEVTGPASGAVGPSHQGSWGDPTNPASTWGAQKSHGLVRAQQVEDQFNKDATPFSSQAARMGAAYLGDALAAVTGRSGSMSRAQALSLENEATDEKDTLATSGDPGYEGASSAGAPTSSAIAAGGYIEGQNTGPALSPGAAHQGGWEGTAGQATGPASTAAGESPGAAHQGGWNDPTNDSDGADSGGDSDGTVLCTELYRQGIMPEHIYRADQAYGRMLPADVVAGYHLFAVPLARQMRRRPWVTAVMRPLVMAWARRMAQRMGATSEGSALGAVIEAVGVPVCGAIGCAMRVVKTMFASFGAPARFVLGGGRR